MHDSTHNLSLCGSVLVVSSRQIYALNALAIFFTVGKTDEAGDEQERPPSVEIEKQDVEHSEKEGHASSDEPQPSSDEYMFSIGRDQVLSRVKLSEYDSFALAILKPLLGEYYVRRLLTKGVGPRKIENAVLAKSSWQRVPLLVDPYNKGLGLIRIIEDGENLLEIDLAER